MLNFCLSSVWNLCSDRKGGHMSPMACSFADGSLRLATWRFLQIILGIFYYVFGKLNIIPVVHPYGGSACNVFSEVKFERMMAIYEL